MNVTTDIEIKIHNRSILLDVIVPKFIGLRKECWAAEVIKPQPIKIIAGPIITGGNIFLIDEAFLVK